MMPHESESVFWMHLGACAGKEVPQAQCKSRPFSEAHASGMTYSTRGIHASPSATSHAITLFCITQSSALIYFVLCVHS